MGPLKKLDAIDRLHRAARHVAEEDYPAAREATAYALLALWDRDLNSALAQLSWCAGEWRREDAAEDL
jgi:hypothetical protein